jgi:hypothetical protein
MAVVNSQYLVLNPTGATTREISEVVNNVLNGKTNNTGLITIAVDSATSTILYDERIGFNSAILLTPITSGASGYAYYIDNNAKGSATIRHAANTTAGRTFRYVVVG